MHVTNETIARWSATLSTLSNFIDNDKARSILEIISSDMDTMLNTGLITFKPVEQSHPTEYKLVIEKPEPHDTIEPSVVPADEPVEPAVFENEVVETEPVEKEPVEKEPVETELSYAAECETPQGRNHSWSDDELSILRCASNKLQAIEYYNLSTYKGTHTDKAVENTFYRLKRGNELIRVNDKVKIIRRTSAYVGKIAKVTKICDDKINAIIELESENIGMMQFKISGLKVMMSYD